MGKTNNNTTKVGGVNKADKPEEKPPKEKKEKIDFPIKEAKYRNEEGQIVTAINEENLLIAVPKTILGENDKVEYAGWDNRKHKPLKRTDFAGMATFLQFQGHSARLHAARLIKIAEDKEQKADRLLKFGDENTRKKAAKVAKMREQLAALEQQLSAEGINVEEI
jgi:hypothetical protein